MTDPALTTSLDFRKYLGFGEYPSTSVEPSFSAQKLLKVAVKASLIFSTVFFGLHAITGSIGFSAVFSSILTLSSCLFLKHIQKKALLPPPQERNVLDGRSSTQLMTRGNSILVTSLGMQTLEWRKKLIQEARYSIEISGSICGGKNFSIILSLIHEQMEKEKKLFVRVMTAAELLTEDNKCLLSILSEQYRDRFRSIITSKNFIFFPEIKVLENHAKMFVVDEKYFICGGSGIQDTLNRDYCNYRSNIRQSLKERLIGTSSRDMDVLVSGPSVKKFRKGFYRLWAKWTYLTNERAFLQDEYYPVEAPERERATLDEFDRDKENVVPNVELACVFGGPENGSETSCYKASKSLILGAKKSIFVANMIFNEMSLIESLSKVSRKNIPLTLITNGRGSSSIVRYFMAVQNRINYHFLNQDNAEIYEYSVGGDLFHKKVMLIDGEISVLGSYNISTKSAFCDDEAMVVVRSKRFAEKILLELQEDKRLSTKVSQREVKYFNSGTNHALASILNFIVCYTVN